MKEREKENEKKRVKKKIKRRKRRKEVQYKQLNDKKGKSFNREGQ